MSKEAMRLALEALKNTTPTGFNMESDKKFFAAIKALEEALAKQEQSEPVAMRYDFDGYGYKYIDSGSGSDWQTRIKDAEPVYTTPQQRKPLTDEQIEAGASALVDSCIAKGHWTYASDESKKVYRAHTKAVLTAAHGIKE